MVELDVEVDNQFVKYISSLKMNSLPMVFMLGSLLASAAFSSAAATNAALQLAVFAVVANIPALITGRMSYVDLAWPYGLVTIGLSPLLQGTATQRLPQMLPHNGGIPLCRRKDGTGGHSTLL